MKLYLLIVISFICCVSPAGAQDTDGYVADSIMSLQYNCSFIKKHPCNSFVNNALTRLRQAYILEKDTPKAIISAKALLYGRTAATCSTDNMYWSNRWPNRSAHDLCEIYFAQKQYDSALKYLYMCDTQFIYGWGCGNGYRNYQTIYACRYADIFLKKEDTGMAIRHLLKEAFNPESQKQIKKLLPLLGAIYKTQYLREKLKFAVEQFALDTANRFFGGYVVFLDVKMITYAYAEDYDPKTGAPLSPAKKNKQAIAYLKQSDFYKSIMAL
ncbi:MAG: hypothetical protein V4649_01860 [Bacteroidota bacterium]